MIAMIFHAPHRHSGERRNPVKHGVRSTQHKNVLSAAHGAFVLDSGVRRNDGEAYLGMLVT
jgi:hypothetical protein